MYSEVLRRNPSPKKSPVKAGERNTCQAKGPSVQTPTLFANFSPQAQDHLPLFSSGASSKAAVNDNCPDADFPVCAELQTVSFLA
jgi:hypothetical protein